MKTKEQKNQSELKSLGVKELQDKADTLRRELLMLRLNAVSMHTKDYSQFKKLRKDIARTLTFLNQKLLGKEASSN
jgi:ribosomal protein L29